MDRLVCMESSSSRPVYCVVKATRPETAGVPVRTGLAQTHGTRACVYFSIWVTQQRGNCGSKWVCLCLLSGERRGLKGINKGDHGFNGFQTPIGDIYGETEHFRKAIGPDRHRWPGSRTRQSHAAPLKSAVKLAPGGLLFRLHALLNNFTMGSTADGKKNLPTVFHWENNKEDFQVVVVLLYFLHCR